MMEGRPSVLIRYIDVGPLPLQPLQAGQVTSTSSMMEGRH
eukprot:CAMPEP_0201095988 /NCGR_PEP_ID=MMETSP0812-20130820/4904_1 /ASSEMBLY_ACC=CAM_ASM_000668 /TAXON_ID=98059 /ORGANISM="Dinobryon sp., Strain UTEXLB2267" /LENGTH=39 /DNA_ID= /DNA_START= /DNA_END= /DNA_ORIENTATION=